MTDVGALH